MKNTALTALLVAGLVGPSLAQSEGPQDDLARIEAELEAIQRTIRENIDVDLLNQEERELLRRSQIQLTQLAEKHEEVTEAKPKDEATETSQQNDQPARAAAQKAQGTREEARQELARRIHQTRLDAERAKAREAQKQAHPRMEHTKKQCGHRNRPNERARAACP